MRHRCPELGSTYRPSPEDWNKHYFYRLSIDSPPLDEDPPQNEEMWRFQMFDQHTKARLAELRLIENCPAGGLCMITTPTRSNTNSYSDVVRLTKGFQRPIDFAAPDAIILPGFAAQSWTFGEKDVKLGYFSYEGVLVSPDLSTDIIWVRVSCGHK